MRKSILSSLLMLFMSVGAGAQTLQFTPLAGYTFGDKFPISGGSARLGDGFTYGGIFSYVAERYNTFDLTYTRQGSTATANSDFLGFTNVSKDISVDYIFLGGSRMYPLSDETLLFTGMNFGTGIFSSKDDSFDTFSRFTFALNGGVKHFFSDRMGFRLQANVSFPVSSPGGTYWWDPATNSSVGTSGYVSVVQFGFTGGLIINLN